jgi:cell volume regulation protein A
MIFFIILSSVIITTIGLGKSKKIPPPDSIRGGFVKPSDETSDDVIISEEVDKFHEKLDGGFVKPSDESKT